MQQKTLTRQKHAKASVRMCGATKTLFRCESLTHIAVILSCQTNSINILIKIIGESCTETMRRKEAKRGEDSATEAGIQRPAHQPPAHYS